MTRFLYHLQDIVGTVARWLPMSILAFGLAFSLTGVRIVVPVEGPAVEEYRLEVGP
jgi:hypothetical protein